MINMKFEFEIPFEWLELRGFGALRGYIEADSEEEAKEKLEENQWNYGMLEVDDYEVSDFECSETINLKEVD